MKKKIFVFLLFSLSLINVFSQKEKKFLFWDYSFGVSLINNSKDFDNYYKSFYNDYKNTFLPTMDLNIGIGHKFNDKISLLIDYGLKTNNIRDKNQYKMLHINIWDFVGEYNLFTKNDFNLLLKTGLGGEHNVFIYNRKNPLQSDTFEYYNAFIPVCLTAAMAGRYSKDVFIGIYLQGNIPVYKGKANVTGLDIEVPNIPTVSQNWISFGIKVRI
jgi:hypothetical protein